MLTEKIYNIEKIRADFPVLAREINGRKLVYLDNAATAQKPLPVIDRMDDFLRSEYATIHRGVYALSQRATMECDTAREKCRKFLNARRSAEIIFVRGATEAINLVAAAYGRKYLKQGDEVLITELEHHANIVPWQQLCLEKGAVLKVVPMNEEGEITPEAFKKLLSDKTRIAAISQMSNALGTVLPVKEMTALAHEAGAVVLVDGAQGAVHGRTDVQDIGCDFYCFSGHKLYGPTGIGVLYGRAELLNAMDPYQTGGEMIESVTFEKTTFAKPPTKFEAGTPPITEIVGLGAAIDYLENIGLEAAASWEEHLLKIATEKLSAVSGLRIIGTSRRKGAVVSFVLGDIHPHDIGTILDQEGICIRTGHHCAQPVMKHFNVPATARASFGLYNTVEEIDLLVKGLEKVREIFS